jgi:hypothetical protein
MQLSKTELRGREGAQHWSLATWNRAVHAFKQPHKQSKRKVNPDKVVKVRR